jgi:hypothetical protein
MHDGDTQRLGTAAEVIGDFGATRTLPGMHQRSGGTNRIGSMNLPKSSRKCAKAQRKLQR